MFNRLKQICENIKKLNHSVESYKNDSVVQSLPTIALVNKAKKYIELNDYENAKKVLQSALDISDQDARVYKYLAIISERERQFPLAVEYLEKFIKLNKNDKDVWYRYGMNLLYSNNFDKAIEAFETANKLNPNNTDIYTGWGMTYMRMKKYALAKDKFNIAAQISKYNFTAILLSAVMEIRCGDYQIAEDKLRFLTKVAPNENSNYEYAHLKLLQNKYEEAIEYAQKALKINPKMLPAYFVLSEIYSINKEYEKTLITFYQAIKEGLDCSILHFEWGKAYIRLYEFSKAEEEFNKSITQEKNFTEAKIGLALIRAYRNDFSLLEEFKEKNASNVYIQEAMGLEYLYNNDLEKAEEMFKKALKTDPNQTYNLYNLTKVYKIKNDNYKIKEYYNKFLESDKNNINVYIEFAQYLISISDYEEAQRKLNRAYKLNQNNIDVLNMLFLTQYTLVKNDVCEYNIKEAISYANKAIELGRFDYTPQKQELEDILKNL